MRPRRRFQPRRDSPLRRPAPLAARVFRALRIAQRIAAVLLLWKRPATTAPTAANDRFLTAVQAARRYVRNAPGVRRVLLRTALFIPGGAAL
ncbi:hypothetical protein [Streptomyces sp. NPDC003032]